MGEAKRRGTFGERRSLAVSIAEKMREQEEQQRREKEAAMTPGELKRRAKAQVVLSAMIGFACSR